jgi:uncharacterized protein YbjQ (UPF0145 family)
MSDIIILFILLALGYVFGSMNERKHYKSIKTREKKYQKIFLSNANKRIDYAHLRGHLVSGNVVVSVDYFKRMVAGLRNIFGGQVSSYESLLDRGRREAMLRLQEQSQKMGAITVNNVRYETAAISQNARGGIGSIEVLAYGTAMVPVDKKIIESAKPNL